MVVAVHALALVSMPVIFLGAIALTQRLASPDRLAICGLVVYGFALAAGMVAGTVSGFVAPGLAREILDARALASEGWRIAFNYNGRLNQAFAQVYTVASSTAIVLWSASILRKRTFPRGVAIYGLLLGPLLVLALASGYLRLHAHGFGLVVLLQAVWFIIVGILLWRSSPP